MRKLFILLAAVAFVAGFTASALANDWAFYGRAHMDTYWADVDKETSATMNFDDSDLDWSLDGTSYIGARVSTDYGIGGRFEYGTSDDADIRLLYGTWNFGAGTLLVGQDYTVVNYGCGECNQVPTFQSHGLYQGRYPQLKLMMGNLEVAAIENAALNKSSELDDTTGTAIVFGDTDVSMPKIEAKYSMNVGPASVAVMGGYNTFDNVDQTGASEVEYSVDCWAVGLGASVGFGPATIRGNLSMSQNPSNYGLGYLEKMYPVLSGNQVLDVDGMGWLVDVGYAVSDTVRVDFGYGQGKLEIDEAGVKCEETFGTYHIFACFTLAKGMCLQPEYSVQDYDEYKTGTTTTDEGKKTYIGLRWKIDW